MNRFLKLGIASLIFPFYFVINGQPAVGAVLSIFGTIYMFSMVGFTITAYSTENIGLTIFDPNFILNPKTVSYTTLSIRTAQRNNLQTIVAVFESNGGQLLVLSALTIVIGLIIAFILSRMYKGEKATLHLYPAIVYGLTFFLSLELSFIGCFLITKEVGTYNISVLLPINAFILTFALISLLGSLEKDFQKAMLIFNIIVTIFLIWAIIVTIIYLNPDINGYLKILGILVVIAFQFVVNYAIYMLQDVDPEKNKVIQSFFQKINVYLVVVVFVVLAFFWVTLFTQFLLSLVGIILILIITMSFVNLNQFNLEERLRTVHEFMLILMSIILVDIGYLIIGIGNGAIH